MPNPSTYSIQSLLRVTAPSPSSGNCSSKLFSTATNCPVIERGYLDLELAAASWMSSQVWSRAARCAKSVQ